MHLNEVAFSVMNVDCIHEYENSTYSCRRNILYVRICNWRYNILMGYAIYRYKRIDGHNDVNNSKVK